MSTKKEFLQGISEILSTSPNAVDAVVIVAVRRLMGRCFLEKENGQTEFSEELYKAAQNTYDKIVDTFPERSDDNKRITVRDVALASIKSDLKDESCGVRGTEMHILQNLLFPTAHKHPDDKEFQAELIRIREADDRLGHIILLVADEALGDETKTARALNLIHVAVCNGPGAIAAKLVTKVYDIAVRQEGPEVEKETARSVLEEVYNLCAPEVFAILSTEKALGVLNPARMLVQTNERLGRILATRKAQASSPAPGSV
ncbi:MAG: hypothetical protein PHY92_00645 [Alphaproteobacteria bacterium]|nr:hypothetical protein [Alphaproteobacteria bacterium]